MKKTLFLVPALLLAGCRGEQVVFQFQPAPATAVALAPTIHATSSPSALISAALPGALEPLAVPTKTTRQLRPRQLAKIVNPLPVNFLNTLETPTQVSRQLSQRLGRRHATEGAAESGLGRVALFFIAVALGVVAGLAALVNVIFSVGFFTALGYTAAGLVVLFLLYSLLSGKKKTTTTPAK